MFPHLPLASYCERAGNSALTAEPLNALSNLAFVLVAILAARRLRRLGSADPFEWTLVAMAAAIGVGSLAFHTIGTPMAMVADVLPIAAFVLAYAIFVIRRLLGFGPAAVAGSLLSVAVCEAAVSTLRCQGGPCLNGSAPYMPALAMLLVSSAVARRSHPAAARRFLEAALVFGVAIGLRSLDHSLCETLTLFGKPRGTHALWHLLNAGTIALLLDVVITSAPTQLGHCAGRRAAP